MGNVLWSFHQGSGFPEKMLRLWQVHGLGKVQKLPWLGPWLTKCLGTTYACTLCIAVQRPDFVEKLDNWHTLNPGWEAYIHWHIIYFKATKLHLMYKQPDQIFLHTHNAVPSFGRLKHLVNRCHLVQPDGIAHLWITSSPHRQDTDCYNTAHTDVSYQFHHMFGVGTFMWKYISFRQMPRFLINILSCGFMFSLLPCKLLWTMWANFNNMESGKVWVASYLPCMYTTVWLEISFLWKYLGGSPWKENIIAILQIFFIWEFCPWCHWMICPAFALLSYTESHGCSHPSNISPSTSYYDQIL